MADQQPQSYATHRQIVPLFHGVLFLLLVATLIGAAVNLYESLGNSERLYSASLILVLTFATTMVMFFSRVFALKAQDRAIRAEEQLRYYILTAKRLDPRLTMRQIVGLRFASDDEFVELVGRAASEHLSEDAIKKAIRSWRPDTYRA
jgi:hypothetical protein